MPKAQLNEASNAKEFALAQECLALKAKLDAVREWGQKWASIPYADSWKWAAQEVLAILEEPVAPAAPSLVSGEALASTAPSVSTLPPNKPAPGMVQCTCKTCKQPFLARIADRKRGWAKFCSKSCKAIKQEQRTGQYKAHLGRKEDESSSGSSQFDRDMLAASHPMSSGFLGHGQE